MNAMPFNSLLEGADRLFSNLVDALEGVLFFSIAGVPPIVLCLLLGGMFFTWRLRFVNLRGFKPAIAIARGQSDGAPSPSAGEISPFQALATALSGSIGLGNIAGVAIALQLGGAGAVFWMTVAALVGMSSKFVECTLGLQYRSLKPDGTTVGGPMYYLSQGLAELGRPRLGSFLAALFSLCGIGAAIGGGNMFQSNQAFAAIAAIVPAARDYDWLFGLAVAGLVGLAIAGGISRIGVVTSKLIPLMVGVYLLACLWIIGSRVSAIPGALALMVREGLSPHGVEGGLVAVLVQGIRRSAFSNNAGLGVAAIAHSAAKTEEPVREGLVAILEPFIDTVLVCNLTALVLLTAGVCGEGSAGAASGSALVAAAFGRAVGWFPLLLAVVIFSFAFSTTITWSYYGERCWAYLLGERSIVVFKGVFLACIVIGAIVNLGSVVDFSDMMLLAMAVPNLVGCVMLSKKVSEDLREYWQR